MSPIKKLKATWLDKDTIHLTSLVADIFNVYKRFHQAFQDDDTLIFDISRKKQSVLKRLEEMSHNPLTGGWKETFLSELEEGNKFKGVDLTEKERRGTYNRCVSDRRSFDAIRNEVIQSLFYFLDNRLDDDSLASTAALSPLKQLSSSPTNEQLRACHKVICPDLPLVDFVSEYKEASEMEHLQSLCTKPLLTFLTSEKQYPVLTIAIARLVAAKPHSADVERLIST